jgi:beta-galactosidase
MPGLFGRSSNLVSLGCLFVLPALAMAQQAPSDLLVPSNIVEIDASRPSPPPQPSDFRGGSSLSQSGRSIGLNDQYLTRDGKPWLPVMGEFHYSRFPEDDWEEEILKMKAGGVEIISSYIFWNHVEEVKGGFDWTGQRDLRHFAELCQKHGVYLYVRIGPWVHGESRYGGLPDWVVKESATRTTEPRFLGFVNDFYEQIGKQIKGLLWRDGGPVIGVQIENEYAGTGTNGGPEYILKLKKMAEAAGLDVPLYTVTGWNDAVWPPGEVIPVYGGYPDAPWDPGSGRIPPGEVYLFRFNSRISGDVSVIGASQSEAPQTDQHAPFLTAEVGGGMQITYHRRPVVSADDVAAIVPVMIGSGANLLGYYMFQGGENPDGKLGPLNESKSTGYPTDLPVKNYDFVAPLSEFGRERPSYGALKLFNYFLNDFGPELAPMSVHAPAILPTGRTDATTVRVAARTHGDSGFVFLENHVRGLDMPAHKQMQLRLQLPSGPMLIPTRPVDVPADSYFVWPVNLSLDGLRLRYSTAQPFCRMERGQTVLYVFFAIPGISPEFAFAPDALTSMQVSGGIRSESSNQILVTAIGPSNRIVFEENLPTGKKLQVVVLTREQAQSATRVSLEDGDHLVLSSQEVYSDGRLMTLRALAQPEFHFSVWPSLPSTEGSRLGVEPQPDDGIFKTYRALGIPRTVLASWTPEQSVKPKPISHSDPATVPTAEDIEAAPRWKLSLPTDAFAGVSDLFLKVEYQGDIARLSAGGHLLTDDFYNGTPWCIGLKRFRRQAESGSMEITIVPWRDRSEVILDDFAVKKVGDNFPHLLRVTVIPEYQLTVP